MTALPPAHGTPIHSISEVAGFAAATAEHARAALSMDGGLGIDVHSGSNSLSLSLSLPAHLLSFQVCSCWRRSEKNVWGGDVTGCYWVCDAIPVAYWRQWNGISDGVVNNPDSFWQKFKLGPNDKTTEIWWSTPSSACCCDPDNEGGFFCASGDEPTCQEDDNWQAAIHPKFGIGDIVWCSLEYASCVWRVLDAFDGLVQFQLKEDLTGCHHSAKAYVIGWQCDTDNECCSETGSTDPCIAGCQPSSEDQGSCDSTEQKDAIKAAVIRVHDPLGIVNLSFAKHDVEVCIVDKLKCQIDCIMSEAIKLTVDSVPVPVHSSSCDEAGSNEWYHLLCVYLKTFMSISLKLYSDSIAKVINHTSMRSRTAPKGTNGWAKWNPAKRRFHVVSYGHCNCNECKSLSSSECENVPGLCDSTASCETEASSCVLFENMDCGKHGGPHPCCPSMSDTLHVTFHGGPFDGLTYTLTGAEWTWNSVGYISSVSGPCYDEVIAAVGVPARCTLNLACNSAGTWTLIFGDTTGFDPVGGIVANVTSVTCSPFNLNASVTYKHYPYFYCPDCDSSGTLTITSGVGRIADALSSSESSVY